MPRILRNYLISFAIIGALLLVVDWIDQRMKAEQAATSAQETTQPAEE